MASSGPSPTFLGTGMSAFVYVALLVGSVVLFVLYGGPLWKVTHSDSHVPRFAVSYLSIIPVVAVVLWLSRRLTWNHLLTAVGTLWAIKLMLTAPIYYALAPGGALEDIGAIAPKRGVAASATADAADAATKAYAAAPGSFAKGTITGTVTGASGPVAIYLVEPSPGRALGERKERQLVMNDDQFAAPLYIATTADELSIRNDGNAMNNAKVRGGSTTLVNAPVPPGKTTTPASLGEVGTFEVRSDTAPTLKATLLITDHPYVVLAGDDGAFALDGVPAGPVRIAALWTEDGAPKNVERDVVVNADHQLAVDLSIGTAQPKLTIRETK